MRIGIIFGGPSREREIAFAGGRTVFDNLNKSLFQPVPIFVDSLQNLVLLDWQYLYKGTIRDFYPPVAALPSTANQFQVYIESLENLEEEALQELIQAVGKPITISELPQYIDFAFLALHGQWGEDGQLQGLLETLKIPYSGSGIRASSIGMDKSFQKKIMGAGGFTTPPMQIIERKKWFSFESKSSLLDQIIQEVALPLVVRPANQGSSIGVAIVHKAEQLKGAIDAAFFMRRLSATQWLAWSFEEQVQQLRDWTDIRTGIGFPMDILEENTGKSQGTFSHPEALLNFLNEFYKTNQGNLILRGHFSEQRVVAESFIEGREFSCVVIQDEDGQPIALPPTEIIKGKEVFDYRSKYLAGLSRKQTPIDLPMQAIDSIRTECERLFEYLEFNVYARIDGFYKADGTIILNDPNTTSGMLPSSFFFHQAAEIGLNPSQFLTYIIYTSLQERIRCSAQLGVYEGLLAKFEKTLSEQQASAQQLKKVAVVLGGYSSERHISVESGRNIFEKLASSAKYEPIPIFLTGNNEKQQLFQLPINLLLKDNADDICDKIMHFSKHPIIDKIQKRCANITTKFASAKVLFEPQACTYADLKNMADAVFIALHGRPGEDGAVQQHLEALQLPFNGSSSDSAAITINKYETLQRLKKEGFAVTDQILVYQEELEKDLEATLNRVEASLNYPLIAKPVDDGCSSAVKKVKNRAQLLAFLQTLFRKTEDLLPEQATVLQLRPKEEFPQKEVALLEALISKEDAIHFLEITGGLLTHQLEDGSLQYELFEPSETLAGGEVLSLEEKFLAGEGQNITPARFGIGDISQQLVSKQVRTSLENAAKVLGVTGYARIDAFVRIYADGRAETIIIEVNSLPGMTPATCIFHQCALNGYSPADFIDRIIQFGEKRVALLAK